MIVLLCTAMAMAPQADLETGARQLWNTAFREKRAGAAQPAAAAKTSPAAQQVGDALVGITVWRLREAQTGDDPETRLRSSDGRQEWTPVRVQADTPLREGERVRVGIEAARTGYLYVIDREQYGGGSFGPPMLIFPTLRLQSGANEVKPGRLVEIPGLSDNPRYFTIRMSRPDQVAEVLTILVTPKPLAEITIGREPLQLTPRQLEEWEKRWGAKVQRLEAVRQVGRPYTRAEKEAATMGARLLTHEEPLPQTMYRLEARPGDPLLVRVPLRIGR
jgi:hypothetical protein